MKALTIRQPWASLIAAGVKTIETRSWSTKFRGPLAIHAGKQWAGGWSTRALWHDPDVDSPERARNDLLVETLRCDPVEDCNGSGYWTVDKYGRSRVPLGAVVATCTLADVVPIVAPPELAGEPRVRVGSHGTHLLYPSEMRPGQAENVTDQLPFGDFTPGRYAWLLTDITPCDPVPAKGRQGLWDWEVA